MECSSAYLDEARARDLEILTGPRPLPMDKAGNLPGSMEWLGAGRPGGA